MREKKKYTPLFSVSNLSRMLVKKKKKIIKKKGGGKKFIYVNMNVNDNVP